MSASPFSESPKLGSQPLVSSGPLPCHLGFDPGAHCHAQEMALIWNVPYLPPPTSFNLCAYDNIIISSSGDPHIKPNLIRLYMAVFIDLERLRKVSDKTLFLQILLHSWLHQPAVPQWPLSTPQGHLTVRNKKGRIRASGPRYVPTLSPLLTV